MQRQRVIPRFVVLPVVLAVAVASCSDETLPTSPPRPSASVADDGEPTAPNYLVTVSAGEQSVRLWPYTGVDFSGRPQDPINFISTGRADPRAIRAALRSLDGDRTAFGWPNVFPFNCTWSDAIGGQQTAYADDEQWVGSSIQLECGSYGPLRFHMRLFREGALTLAGAHFEVLIPGTADHEVLSWELAERLVVTDFVRSGLLGAPPSPTDPITHTPTFREIRAPIYNALPVEIRAAIGGPLANVTANVGIPNDGRATILQLAHEVPIVPDTDNEEFVLQYNQVIPKPFCASGPADFLLAQGPIQLRQTAGVAAAGVYLVDFVASGELTLTPVDPVSRNPVGEPYRAVVEERHSGFVDNEATGALGLKIQREIPDTGPTRGSLFERLHVGSHSQDSYVLNVEC